MSEFQSMRVSVSCSKMIKTLAPSKSKTVGPFSQSFLESDSISDHQAFSWLHVLQVSLQQPACPRLPMNIIIIIIICMH